MAGKFQKAAGQTACVGCEAGAYCAEGISRPRGVLGHWCALAAALSALGWLVHFTAWPMHKQLWSPSYLLRMAGSCGAALALVYALVDTASPKAPPPGRAGQAAARAGLTVH